MSKTKRRSAIRGYGQRGFTAKRLGVLWRSSIRKMYMRECARCDYCDTVLSLKTATLDHVIPLCHGGSDSTDNLVLCCEPCNTRKGDKPLRKSGLKLLRRRGPDGRPQSSSSSSSSSESSGAGT